MVQIQKSATFDEWIAALKDPQAKARILVRITRLSQGNPGDVKPVGEGVSEMRIDYGPGYRVYFKQQGDQLALLLLVETSHLKLETSKVRRRSRLNGV